VEPKFKCGDRVEIIALEPPIEGAVYSDGYLNSAGKFGIIERLIGNGDYLVSVAIDGGMYTFDYSENCLKLIKIKQKTHENCLKDTNPKDAIGVTKIPFHLWPETASIYGALGFLDGMLKYGRSNWRSAGVRVSVYYDACRRHLNAYFEGEENTPDTGLPHLACALACIAILIDAKAAGKLVDDRMYKGGYHKLLEEMTPHVKRLKELHKDKNPKHWTIQDNEENKSRVDMDDNNYKQL